VFDQNLGKLLFDFASKTELINLSFEQRETWIFCVHLRPSTSFNLARITRRTSAGVSVRFFMYPPTSTARRPGRNP
jgi:hypothetical protein